VVRKIAVFAGPTATILNTHPLVTSRKARVVHRFAREPAPEDRRRFDALRPQRLAAPVTVYVEQFSAHPLERDAEALYAPADGYVSPDGDFSRDRRSDADVPVYEVLLEPEDGLYPLPYMARQHDGRPWDADAVDPHHPERGWRQPFFPDASRLFEEIDRLHVGADGDVNALSRMADFEFFRPAPPGGYTAGLDDARRTDVGRGDVPAEELGVDFYPYRPAALRREPLRGTLARITNEIDDVLASGRYDGGLWLEGSPFVEETSYWLNLLVGTDRPVVACAGGIGPSGWPTVVDAVRYLVSDIWADPDGGDRLGVVCIQDERVFTSREMQKADDRPGGYVATGGHGGVVASMGNPGPPVLTFLPVRRGTATSDVRRAVLPAEVPGLAFDAEGRVTTVTVRTKDELGGLVGSAMPSVHILKHTRYQQADVGEDDRRELEVLARVRRELETTALVGFVIEGSTPYGDVTAPLEAGLRELALLGVPFVKVGRGDVGGFVPHERVPLGVAGGNLTATKARMLLMACLLRFGALPPARDPSAPTPAELEAITTKFAQYQAVFDTH
jgi:L-asparaginase